MLALCRLLELPLEGYLNPSHPIQQRIRSFCERIMGDEFTSDRIAFDGCGAPVYATSLRSAARGFARLACGTAESTADSVALSSVCSAIAKFPGEHRREFDVRHESGPRF